MVDFLETILNGKKIDLTNKEEHDKFVENVKKLKTDSDNSFFGMFGLNNFINDEVDNLVNYADKVYDDAKSLDVKEETTVPDYREEVPEVDRPSDKLNDLMKKNINNLVNEYLDTVIIPHYDMDDKQYNDVHDGLFEFAAWIYTR